MDHISFCYWLRGFFEISGETSLTKEQVDIISKHLALVFQEKSKDMKSISEKDWQKILPEGWQFENGQLPRLC